MSRHEKLEVYQVAHELSMEIFWVSQKFPKEEKYSLTDQIRRSSRSVCANLAEGYRKRQYLKHFIAKLSDADMENTETQVWLEFALKCKYIEPEVHQGLLNKSQRVGAMLGAMMKSPNKLTSRN